MIHHHSSTIRETECRTLLFVLKSISGWDSFLSKPIQPSRNSYRSINKGSTLWSTKSLSPTCSLNKMGREQRPSLLRSTLHTKWPLYFISPSSKFLIQIPGTLIHTFINMCHCTFGTGHPGAERKEQRIKEKYTFHKMSSLVKSFCKECHSCLQVKGPKPKPAGIF